MTVALLELIVVDRFATSRTDIFFSECSSSAGKRASFYGLGNLYLLIGYITQEFDIVQHPALAQLEEHVTVEV